jgi:2-C-methyl-D-erythritol 4-phosphate cytidylyltransferase/2-C-methyl-D-erythritol 2,4-cyclodiphosphate synthase
MSVAAIVVAAGRGERLGGTVPKQLLEIGGRSLVRWSVDALAASGLIEEIIVVLPDDLVARAAALLGDRGGRVRVTSGGARRQDSVAAGFALVPSSVELVLVHDAARPFVTRGAIARTIDAARAHGAAIAALPARDTVKRAAADASGAFVRATLRRDQIWLAQTPQAFRRDVLAAAIALGQQGVEVTDEAALAERAGHAVRLVEGDEVALKITSAADLRHARALHAAGVVAAADGEEETAMATTSVRIGTGYDLHRLVAGRPLILGGVRIAFERGLAGHSDADAVSHAVTDALLGAANLGDIGKLFPDDDPRWKDVDSLQLLELAVARVREAGLAVGNVDVVVIAERPRIGPHTEAMRANLARVLGVGPDRVSIKGKTNETVDATGRGEAIAVHAVALLVAGHTS